MPTSIQRSGYQRRLAELTPHARLVQKLDQLPLRYGAPVYGCMYERIRKQIRRAAAYVRTGPQEKRSVSIGSGIYRDLPLNLLLRQGRLVGVDYKKQPILYPDLRPDLFSKVTKLSIDASLYVSDLIAEFESVFEQHEEPSSEFFKEIFRAVRRTASGLPYQRLPFSNESIDFWVCNSFFWDTYGVMREIFFDLFDEHYGENSWVRFFGEEQTEDSHYAGKFLSIYTELTKQALSTHFREMRRVLRPGGVAFVSVGQSIVEIGNYRPVWWRFFGGTVELDVKTIAASSVDVVEEGSPMEGLKVQTVKMRLPLGKEISPNLVKADIQLPGIAHAARFQLLEGYHYLYVRDYDTEEDVGEATINETVIIRKPRKRSWRGGHARA